ncbi:type 1 glutamine amidotransferase domain-containing protein [Melghirimyces algeriensis]|uniref:Protease I n=1 Tax=Melghirimyces algeriensis TaxID=910412 RepID=A0A521DF52_9BACL|nr:type 1 glutamine amidotransferase domain-containing protein [Melghirimyces algeriensis]SMO70256.1 protease I [Melghirimyces algeriensis]
MRLKDKSVVCFVDHEFEDLELWYPIIRLQEEGATVHLAGPQAKTGYRGKYGVPATSDKSYAELDSNAYHGVLVPGGWAPDKIRRSTEVLQFVREMDQAKKPIGQICHAGWVLISAGILAGRNVTSTPGIKDDMTNAGAKWVDEPVVIDHNLVSSRRPPDLALYAKAFCDLLAKQ